MLVHDIKHVQRENSGHNRVRKGTNPSPGAFVLYLYLYPSPEIRGLPEISTLQENFIFLFFTLQVSTLHTVLLNGV